MSAPETSFETDHLDETMQIEFVDFGQLWKEVMGEERRMSSWRYICKVAPSVSTDMNHES
jgi:hypothetical protein